MCDELNKNAEPRRCADAFEAALRGGAAAPERVACAVASAKARVKYDFDFAKGVWAVRDTGAVVSARETLSGPDARREGERTDAAAKKKSATDATRPDPELRVQTATEATPETSARAEETRGARLRCFAAGHDAALAAAAAKRRAREARVAAATLKRAAAQVPLPKCPGAKERRFARREPRDAAGASPDADAGADETDAARWRMLRLRETGDVVFFDAPDACEALVQAWLSGETPWPEIRVMELSREARAAWGVPRGAPGPVAPAALAAAAAAELRCIAEEDAEARLENSAAASVPEAPSSVARLPPGSTATPQQASIIERLVSATGASEKALEAAAKSGNAKGGDVRDVESLKASLRETIREKHAFKTRATAAEARVAALEAALAAAGIQAP